MIKVEDLWVGDQVVLKKSNRIGTYEGKKDGKLKVKVRGKIVLTSAKNLVLHIEKEEEKVTFPSIDLIQDTIESRPPPVLDLHIEKLHPSLKNSRAERIIDYQIKAAKQHIEDAIRFKYPRIALIHGKGQGVLKQEIRHLLSLYTEVKSCEIINDGGGTEATFTGL